MDPDFTPRMCSCLKKDQDVPQERKFLQLPCQSTATGSNTITEDSVSVQ